MKVEKRCKRCEGRGWHTRFLGFGIKSCRKCNGVGKWEESMPVEAIITYTCGGQTFSDRVGGESRDAIVRKAYRDYYGGQRWIPANEGGERRCQITSYDVRIVRDGDRIMEAKP
jgi:hypothetical protein